MSLDGIFAPKSSKKLEAGALTCAGLEGDALAECLNALKNS
jgi:hypothetical protein